MDTKKNILSIVKNFFATINVDYKRELFCPGLEGKGEVLKHANLLDKAFGDSSQNNVQQNS